MMGIVDQILMARFFDSWIDRFESNTSKFITPDNEKVVNYSRSIDFSTSETKEDVVKKVWVHTFREIKYKLSKEWKTPEETLKDKMGDCEDMCFLILSVFPNVGIENADFVVGNMTKQNGTGGPHTWVEVDGMVVDPTGLPEDVDSIEYEAVHTFNIQTKIMENCKPCQSN